MKILQLSNKVPFPPKDGGSIATANLTKGFALANCQVTVLAMNTTKHHVEIKHHPFLDENPDLKVELFGVDVDTRIKPVSAIFNLFFSRLPYNAVRFISNDFKKELIRHLNTNTFDVVQLEGLYLTPYIPLIRKYSKSLISLRAHNIEHEIWQRTAIQANGLRKKYIEILCSRIKHMEENWVNKYDALVTITQRDTDVFNTMENTKPVHVTPSGIFINEMSLEKPDSKELSLFHLGALDWSPNQEGLLWFLKNCWKQIHTELPELKFYIAGRNAPEWFIRKIKLPNIIYCGEVDDAQEFMKSKTIMIVPLLSGSGMRIKIIEGMALGKAVVTTDIGTEGINSSHQVNIMISNTPAEYVKSVEDLISDAQLRNKIEKQAFSFVTQNFCNTAITKGLVRFYTQIINTLQKT